MISFAKKNRFGFLIEEDDDESENFVNSEKVRLETDPEVTKVLDNQISKCKCGAHEHFVIRLLLTF